MKIDNEMTMMQSRADTYSLLSRCFFPPDKNLLVTLQSIETTEENLWRELIENARATDSLDSLDSLSVDYAMLFVGPFKLLAPPYGSVYLDSGALVAGDSTSRVEKLYREEGVDVNIKEIPDHIGIEFAFMHHLILQEISSAKAGDAEAIARCEKKQAMFLKEFLYSWISQFSQAIGAHSQTKFYRSLGKIAEIFVVNDLALLEQELGK